MVDVAGISIVAAFAAGTISFLSPCCLPLVPGYLAVVSDTPTSEGRAAPWRIASFLAGFVAVFVALGATASAIGSALHAQREVLTLAASAVVTLAGLMMLRPEGVSMSWLSATSGRVAARLSTAGPLLIGMAFAIAWTPCIGPILGAILAVATTRSSTESASLLLAVYAVGLAVPFMVVGVAWQRGYRGLRALSRHQRLVNAIGGALLIALGMLLALDRLYVVSAALQRWAAAAHLDLWRLL